MWLYKIIRIFFPFVKSFTHFFFLEVLYHLTIFLKGIKTALALGILWEWFYGFRSQFIQLEAF